MTTSLAALGQGPSTAATAVGTGGANTSASANGGGGAITALLGLVGFAATLAGGYAWGARAAGRAAKGCSEWPHASVAAEADEIEAEYEEMGGRS